MGEDEPPKLNNSPQRACCHAIQLAFRMLPATADQGSRCRSNSFAVLATVQEKQARCPWASVCLGTLCKSVKRVVVIKQSEIPTEELSSTGGIDLSAVGGLSGGGSSRPCAPTVRIDAILRANPVQQVLRANGRNQSIDAMLRANPVQQVLRANGRNQSIDAMLRANPEQQVPNVRRW